MSKTKNADSRIQPVAQSAAALSGTQSNSFEHSGGISDRLASASTAPPTLQQKAQALAAGTRHDAPAQSCQQSLKITLFFDGTGNNMKADVHTLEHSNVARMYRAHVRESATKDVYRIYIPGIGTPFPEIGDDGKGPIPFVNASLGMGAVGQGRLDWAFKEVQNIVHAAKQRAQNPTNKILMISFSVFGFSRGATLARAFVRDLVKPDGGHCEVAGDALRWRAGGYPAEINFMGLWDTVASVGTPMSANNIRAIRRGRFNAGNAVRAAIGGSETPVLRAVDLAFGRPGADPSPGRFSGHGAWAEGLAIPPMVKICVHITAAHEIRNSFPVDSVQRGNGRPANCKEFVYPGVHSDVGGGYRPGEGGLGQASPMDTAKEKVTDANLVLSVIPLKAMFDEARLAGVPLLQPGSVEWGQDNIDDFDASPYMCSLFNHYLTVAGQGGQPLGTTFLANTRLHLAWTFRRLRLNNAQASSRLASNEQVWAQDEQKLNADIAALRNAKFKAQAEEARLTDARNQRLAGNWQNLNGAAAAKAIVAEYDPQIATAGARASAADTQMKELTARKDSLPTRGTLQGNISEFETQLLHDAMDICAAIAKDNALRQQLRPHYRNVVETYEAEFLHGRGLDASNPSDAKIIQFFDNFVHDSLADFNQDCTLPSDPRVIYLGGNTKLDYAGSEPVNAEQGREAEAA